MSHLRLKDVPIESAEGYSGSRHGLDRVATNKIVAILKPPHGRQPP